MSTLEALVFLGNVASSLFMAGLIWTIQVVHYPLFAKVGAEGFIDYESTHQRLITYIVAPAMFAELITSVLLIWIRPEAIPLSLVIAGIVLVAINWLSTALIQMPLHLVLSKGYDRRAIRRLVRSNWLRTAAWSAHGLVVCAMVIALAR